MPELYLTLMNKPVPQGRPRVGKFGTWDPNLDIKNWTRIQLKDQVSRIIHEPIVVEMNFFMPIPKSIPKKILKLINVNKYPHTKKPDIDNLIILVLNCMNQIVFADDRQVWMITASKRYDENPRTEIVVKWEDSNLEKDMASGQRLK